MPTEPKIHQYGDVQALEYVYDSGLTEIGIYTPEVLPQAGPVLHGVISRLPGNKAWFFYAAGGAKSKHSSKRKAIAEGINCAVMSLPEPAAWRDS